MSVRIKYTILFVALVGVILFFFSLAIFSLSENYRQNDFQIRLRDKTISRFKILEASDYSVINEETNINESFTHSIRDDWMIIYDERFAVIYQDSIAIRPSKTLLENSFSSKHDVFSINSSEIIGFTYKFKENTYQIVASATDEFGMRYINNLKRTLLVRGLILMFIIGFTGWFYVGRMLKPISDIVEQADKITSSNLNLRLTPAKNNDEIGRLITTFNKMLERLETSFKIQKRFVSNASHEMRNPLTAINGQIDVALMRDRTPEEYKAILQSVSKDIKNVRTISNNLLELANSEVETLFKELKEVRIDEILWEIRDAMAKRNPNHNINIVFDGNIDHQQALTCRGKEGLLKTAFINIVDNACKFSEDSTVNITLQQNDSWIKIVFKDNGIGIPPDFLERIFEPFSRGKNTHGIHGSGIGMSLVYRIIKLHSGNIIVDSKENVGTTVVVELPTME